VSEFDPQNPVIIRSVGRITAMDDQAPVRFVRAQQAGCQEYQNGGQEHAKDGFYVSLLQYRDYEPVHFR